MCTRTCLPCVHKGDLEGRRAGNNHFTTCCGASASLVCISASFFGLPVLLPPTHPSQCSLGSKVLLGSALGPLSLASHSQFLFLQNDGYSMGLSPSPKAHFLETSTAPPCPQVSVLQGLRQWFPLDFALCVWPKAGCWPRTEKEHLKLTPPAVSAPVTSQVQPLMFFLSHSRLTPDEYHSGLQLLIPPSSPAPAPGPETRSHSGWEQTHMTSGQTGHLSLLGTLNFN